MKGESIMSEWDRLWKEVYGDPISEIAIKTKALGDDMQKKLEAIKNFAEEMAPCYMSERIIEILEVKADE